MQLQNRITIGAICLSTLFASCSKNYHYPAAEQTGQSNQVKSYEVDGDRTSSGGDGIVCLKPKTKQVQSVEFLDYKYAEIQGTKIDLGGASTDGTGPGYLGRKINYAIQKIKHLDSKLYRFFSDLAADRDQVLARLEKFENTEDKGVVFIDSTGAGKNAEWDLVDIKDGNLDYEISKLSNNDCYVAQIAKQQKNMVYGTPFIEIDKKYATLLSKDHYAGLLIHELLLFYFRHEMSVEGFGKNAADQLEEKSEDYIEKILGKTDNIRRFNIMLAGGHYQEGAKLLCEQSGVSLDLTTQGPIQQCVDNYYTGFLSQLLPLGETSEWFGSNQQYAVYQQLKVNLLTKKEQVTELRDTYDKLTYPVNFSGLLRSNFNHSVFITEKKFNELINQSQSKSKPNQDPELRESQSGSNVMIHQFRYDIYSMTTVFKPNSGQHLANKNQEQAAAVFPEFKLRNGTINYYIYEDDWQESLKLEQSRYQQSSPSKLFDKIADLDTWLNGDVSKYEKGSFFSKIKALWPSREDFRLEDAPRLNVLAINSATTSLLTNNIYFREITFGPGGFLVGTLDQDGVHSIDQITGKSVPAMTISIPNQGIKNLKLPWGKDILFGQTNSIDDEYNTQRNIYLAGFYTDQSLAELTEHYGFKLHPKYLQHDKIWWPEDLKTPKYQKIILAENSNIIISVEAY